jgi:hypothetical protein
MANRQVVTAASLTGNPGECPQARRMSSCHQSAGNLSRPTLDRGVLMSGVLEGFSSLCQNLSRIRALLRPDRTSVKKLVAFPRTRRAGLHHLSEQAS